MTDRDHFVQPPARARRAPPIRGLYGIADAGDGRDPEALVAALLDGGCRLVQLRCKGWDEGALLALTRRALQRCRAVGAALFVNDAVEVALQAGADGVHVGQLDTPAAEVRSRVGDRLAVGVSHNTLEQLEASLPWADYVAVGPMWSTPHLSHPKPVRGLALLREARAQTRLPLVAIGGIRADRVDAVRAAGADAWAVIGAICDAADPTAATRALLG